MGGGWYGGAIGIGGAIIYTDGAGAGGMYGGGRPKGWAGGSGFAGGCASASSLLTCCEAFVPDVRCD